MGRIAVALRALRIVAWQRLIGALQGLQPVITLGCERVTLCIALQLFGPALQRAGFRGQCQWLTSRQRLITLLQVFQQHTP